MKVVLKCLIATVFVVAATGDSEGIDLTRYTFPTSTSQQAFLNGAFNFAGTSADCTQTAYNLSGSATYDLSYRSLPFSYVASVLGNAAVSQSSVDGADSRDGYNVRANTRANRYFSNTQKWFGFGSVTLDYRKLQSMEEADDPYLDVTAGLGYGRTIDATVLKQAVRLNDDFKRFNVITGDIPDEQLLELARVIDRESEFRAEHGVVEYKKYWFEAMEQVIESAGVLREGGLGAVGAIRVEEVLAEPTGRRYHGWEARAGVGVVLSDYDGEAGDPLASLEFDWSRPVSMELQLNNNAYMRTVFEDDQTYTIGDVFQIYYEITNRIDWDNSLRGEYLMMTADGAEDALSMVFSSGFILYVENQLTFNPTFILSHTDPGVTDAITDWQLLGGISYRLK